MKPRAWLFAAALVAGTVELVSACSQQVPLALRGAKCEFDEQCARDLVCKCIQRRNPDEEGPDEVLVPGTCQNQGYSCAKDAGVVDAARTDTGVTDTASADAGDGG